MNFTLIESDPEPMSYENFSRDLVGGGKLYREGTSGGLGTVGHST
jgi:hypothetical protein